MLREPAAPEPDADARRDPIDRRTLLTAGLASAAGLALAGRALFELGARSSEPAAAAGGGPASEDGDADDGDDAFEPRLVVPPPPIVSRAEWGADESIRGEARYDSRVERIVVHHTATFAWDGDWPGHVRQIYENEIAAGYRDMPYHLLIDPNGTIYEGRWARDLRDGEPPDGEDARGRSVRGGHTRRNNRRALGFALIGNYVGAQPPPAAIDALVQVLVWKCARWGLDPHGVARATHEDGSELVLPVIFGHGDVRLTECPGLLAQRLPELRDRTAAGLAAAAAAD